MNPFDRSLAAERSRLAVRTGPLIPGVVAGRAKTGNTPAAAPPRTIADLVGAELIASEHVSKAIQFRSLDRQLWT